jgi:hypothetical protein
MTVPRMHAHHTIVEKGILNTLEALKVLMTVTEMN